jgi:predicted RNA-binding Zn-ribbon protein involved in translation (DUF1610 family)
VSILKPVPIVPQVVRKLCPHCGKASYSRDGIHPQCALQQADARRNAMLRERRKLEPKVEKPPRRIYSKKCPGCGIHVHVRVITCDCGHTFATTKT